MVSIEITNHKIALNQKQSYNFVINKVLSAIKPSNNELKFIDYDIAFLKKLI
jgi:hypothetical protein